ncbi:hypothetical protein MesoLjLa_65220 (plasmid) [Mesorhizobium sp. L-2-11]|nr:hypothetical protein MesoLjLa_65220 [Mesorhizobium sp. L-2-11]
MPLINVYEAEKIGDVGFQQVQSVPQYPRVRRSFGAIRNVCLRRAPGRKSSMLAHPEPTRAPNSQATSASRFPGDVPKTWNIEYGLKMHVVASAATSRSGPQAWFEPEGHW